jgi:hypothetical protein
MNIMRTWQWVWREGIAPSLSTAALEALAQALERGDRGLVQWTVTFPPSLQALSDHPVEATCAVGYCGWRGEGLKTVAEVQDYYTRVCFEAGQRLGEPAACRWFLNWCDDTPRAEMCRLLLAEVRETLSRRGRESAGEPGSAPTAA